MGSAVSTPSKDPQPIPEKDVKLVGSSSAPQLKEEKVKNSMSFFFTFVTIFGMQPEPVRRTSVDNPRRRSFEGGSSERSRFGPKLALDDFNVGDVVGMNEGERSREGIIVERINRLTVRVDFDENSIEDVLVENLTLILKFDDFEVGEIVELKPPGSHLFFVGKIVAINTDDTIDVLMESDDPDDIERGVKKSDCRKLMTRRDLAVSRWRKAFMVATITNMFKEFKSEQCSQPFIIAVKHTGTVLCYFIQVKFLCYSISKVFMGAFFVIVNTKDENRRGILTNCNNLIFMIQQNIFDLFYVVIWINDG